MTLSLPGSYIFASNLQPPANKAGIRIASNDVDIDMNGFRLNGAAVATTGIFGVDFNSVTIRNGTITGFDAHGIYTTGDYWIVENMRAIQNGADGIHVGNDSSVRGSTVTTNGNNGISCRQQCLVEDSTSSDNGAIGILLSTGTVLGNVIFDNFSFGILSDGFSGYGNNTLVSNNGGGAQVSAGTNALHPNACAPACP